MEYETFLSLCKNNIVAKNGMMYEKQTDDKVERSFVMQVLLLER